MSLAILNDIDFIFLRTRTLQGDGNYNADIGVIYYTEPFKNQNPARGRKPVRLEQCHNNDIIFKNQHPARGRSAYLQPPLPERGRGTA